MTLWLALLATACSQRRLASADPKQTIPLEIAGGYALRTPFEGPRLIISSNGVAALNRLPLRNPGAAGYWRLSTHIRDKGAGGRLVELRGDLPPGSIPRRYLARHCGDLAVLVAVGKPPEISMSCEEIFGNSSNWVFVREILETPSD